MEPGCRLEAGGRRCGILTVMGVAGEDQGESVAGAYEANNVGQPASRPVWMRRAAFTLAALVVAASAIAADNALRSRTVGELLDVVEATEREMERYQPIAVDLITALEGEADGPDTVLPGRVQQIVGAEVGRIEADLVVEAAALDEPFFAPWWGAASDAQEAYRAHVEAWTDHLRAVTENALEVYGPTPEITSTFVLACDALTDAAVNDGHEERISDVCAE